MPVMELRSIAEAGGSPGGSYISPFVQAIRASRTLKMIYVKTEPITICVRTECH